MEIEPGKLTVTDKFLHEIGIFWTLDFFNAVEKGLEIYDIVCYRNEANDAYIVEGIK